MTEENIKKILPIGSVVTLKDGNKKVMIIGRIQVHKDTQKVYDYCACYYPEGILDPHELFLFMHGDIEQVYFMGMQDADERGFCQFMEERLKELNMLKSA